MQLRWLDKEVVRGQFEHALKQVEMKMLERQIANVLSGEWDGAEEEGTAIRDQLELKMSETLGLIPAKEDA